MADEENCGNCKHSKELFPMGAVMRALECYGAPPAVIFTDQGPASVFPHVNSKWRCAQWKAKEVKLAGVTPIKPQEKTGETPA